MRFPRPRFTIRRLMVVVLIAAVLLGSLELWRRSRHFRRLERDAAFRQQANEMAATEFADMQASLQSVLDLLRLTPDATPAQVEKVERDVEDLRKSAVMHRRKADHWIARRSDFARAAARPWLAGGADPPEPE